MVSVILATTGRPDMAERCVTSLIETTGGAVEIVAAVDADPETRDRLQPLVNTLDYSDELRGASNAWHDALVRATGDQIVLAADDLEFQPGWLHAALQTLTGFPDGWGLVGFNDGHWGEELATHYMMSRRLIVEVLGGRIMWDYGHSFTDVETCERARRAGRYAWCEDARVFHRHWLFGDRPQDATDTRTLPAHSASAARFDARRAAGFPNDQKAVIHMSKTYPEQSNSERAGALAELEKARRLAATAPSTEAWVGAEQRKRDALDRLAALDRRS